MLGSVAAGAGRQCAPRLESDALARPRNFTVGRRRRVIGPRTKETHDECEFTH